MPPRGIITKKMITYWINPIIRLVPRQYHQVPATAAIKTHPDESLQVLALYEVLGAIMEGLAAPLKVRIMQVLVPQNPLVLNFRLLNLIAFYDVTLRNLQLGGSSVSEVSSDHVEREGETTILECSCGVLVLLVVIGANRVPVNKSKAI